MKLKNLHSIMVVIGTVALASMLGAKQAHAATVLLDPGTIIDSGNAAFSAAGHTNILLGTCTTCDPDTAVYTMNGPSNNNAADIMAITGFTNTILLYKDNVGGSEEGSFQGSYETVFSNTNSDPSNADLTYGGGPLITTAQWLEVKDGNQMPSTYLFDISGWDGKMLIDMNNFWPNQGAISHVTIWGITVIPLPAAFPLFGTGLGLLAFLGWRRRRQAQAV